jgi:uncharacterized membrane protein YfcA
MTYQERRAIVSVISTLLISTLYSAYMAQRYPEASAYSAEVFRFWGAFFLILIPVSIVAKIIIYILFSIFNTVTTREQEPSITDERDKLIDLKATRNSLVVFTAGFLAGMLAAALGQPPTVMFIAFIASGVLAEVVSDLSQFYFYRRGF